MTAVDRPDNGQDELVWVQLPADDVAFIAGFDPDRDRTASRADMVRVVEHLQAALASGRAGAGEQQRQRVVAAVLAHRMVAGSRRGVACLCGWSGPGAEFDEHRGNATADFVLALLDRTQPDGEAGRG